MVPVQAALWSHLVSSPVQKTAKHLFTSVDDRINSYKEKFRHLREAIEGSAILQTEIVVTRMLDIMMDSGEPRLMSMPTELIL